jgi:methylmalonyl-CoA/ethylmalonyl-CoA epimerase
MNFHHLGMATESLEADLSAYAAIGYRAEGPMFTDPAQGIRGVFLVGDGPCLELLEPLPGSRTLMRLLQRGVKCYHHAYEVAALEEAIDSLRRSRAQVVSPPKPAVAFSGRRIAFVVLPNGWIVELIETLE